MKIFCILSAFALVGTCATSKYTVKIDNLKESIKITDSLLIVNYSNTITKEELKKELYEFASDSFEGREVGTKGQKLAAEFLKDYYIQEKIASPLGNSNYYQSIPASFFSNGIGASENILAYIEGTENHRSSLLFQRI